MVISEIDDAICPYTVGHEDCKVLPRSFRTLVEAEAYLAEQDKGSLERGEFYLDGPERDNAAYNRSAGGVRMNPIVAVPTVADPVEIAPESTRIESQTTARAKRPRSLRAIRAMRGAWKREIEELCRALETQQSAHTPSADVKKK